jgi:hypothetical protein
LIRRLVDAGYAGDYRIFCVVALALVQRIQYGGIHGQAVHSGCVTRNTILSMESAVQLQARQCQACRRIVDDLFDLVLAKYSASASSLADGEISQFGCVCDYCLFCSALVFIVEA